VFEACLQLLEFLLHLFLCRIQQSDFRIYRVVRHFSGALLSEQLVQERIDFRNSILDPFSFGLIQMSPPIPAPSGRVWHASTVSLIYSMPMFQKYIAILLVFSGEALSIAAELVASKRVAADGANYISIFIWMFVCIAFGGAFLISGYMLGYLHLKNIWIIAAISIGSILIVEPILAFLLFRQLPTMGATIGLLFGILGTLAAIFLQ
jgi:hypothetical protein